MAITTGGKGDRGGVNIEYYRSERTVAVSGWHESDRFYEQRLGIPRKTYSDADFLRRLGFEPDRLRQIASELESEQ